MERLDLKSYAQLEVTERGKSHTEMLIVIGECSVTTGKLNTRRNVVQCDESRGIVPLKLWKHSGGIALSQYQNNYYSEYVWNRVRVDR